MPRPRKYDTEIVIRKIMDVFWSKGFEATSLSDLMVATELNKGSLYAFFGDKAGMFHRALLAYEEIAVLKMVETMNTLPSREALEAFMTAPALAVEANDRRGCFLCNSLGEFDQLGDFAKTLATRNRKVMLDAIEQALVRLDRPADAITDKALELLALYFGLRMLARGHATTLEIRAIGRSALASI